MRQFVAGVTVIRGTLAGVALLAAAANALPAGAGEIERVKTRVTIEDNCTFGDCRVAHGARRNYTATFFGEVRSRADRCERRRTVSLYRQVPNRGGKLFAKIDSTRSERNGSWEIVRDDKPGFTDYFVRVTRDRRGDLVCKPARSLIEGHGDEA